MFFSLRRKLAALRLQTQASLQIVNERLNKMAVDTSKLTAIVTDLQAKAAQTATDVSAILAKLAGITSNDPAVQAVVDQAVTDLTAVRDGLAATDAAAEA